jgi:hypothetical protein|eukprot:COSAG02_NODE_1904_length_10439_cov_157.636267_9_plen_44_part_00
MWELALGPALWLLQELGQGLGQELGQELMALQLVPVSVAHLLL